MKYKIIYIEWEDAVDDTSVNWKTSDEIESWLDNSAWIVHQFGYLIKEDKYGIVVASKMEPGNNEYEATFKGISRIPKSWIRKRKVLKI